MIHTKIKWFFAWDYEKEEAWLNAMSKRGLQLIDVSFCTFRFTDGVPGEYTYRLEFMDNLPHSAAGSDYIAFLEETGVEFVGSFLRWAYFRKKSADGPFELFSDIDSLVSHLNRLLVLFGIVGISNFINGLSNFIRAADTRDDAALTLGVICCVLGGLL